MPFIRSTRRSDRAVWVGLWLLAAPAFSSAPAEDAPVTVSIGAVRCFVVRCPDGSQTPQERADGVQEVFARHLGAARGVFTLRKAAPASDRLEILLNGDPVISVTTNDARATGYRKTDPLATVWKRALERGYRETQSQSGP